MAKTVIIDEIHLVLRIPIDTSDDRAEEIRRTLASHDFMSRLRRAVLVAVRAFSDLAVVRAALTR